jgi:integrase
MPRPRSPENRNLPPGVYREKGRFVFRSWDGARLKSGVVLCRDTAPLSQVWSAYEALQPKKEQLLRDLVRDYMVSEKFGSLAYKTRRSAESAFHNLLDRPMASGATFGDTPVAVITPGVIRKYLDHRKESPVAANREVAYLSAAFSWAYERDLVTSNPCKGVRRNTEKARTRYVSDEEYAAVYALATSSPPYIQPAMELAYLCRMRINEVLAARWSDVGEEGLLVRRSKGSRDGVTLWSDRLRAVIAACRADGKVLGMTLIHDRKGAAITYEGFSTAWQRLMARAKEHGVETFTFHDLKAKGVSDFEGDKQKASGHKTAAMVAVYDRKVPTVGSTR